MRPTPTRTLNPLPFQDLEPHRFEDLVRQLAYDFRDWVSLEAIGRAGADEGMDIRGLERVRTEATGENDDDGDATPSIAPSRTWIFQCKREKTMSPARVRAAIAESIPTSGAAPHGFVLAVACDLSKKARDAFRDEMVARGVQEFSAWARGELEDLLVQPRNDRLLFAYFGLSLEPRRRSLATSIRARVALKKQLRSLFEGEDRSDRYLLLRDPTDERYPRTKPGDDAPGRWGLYQFVHARQPNKICILFREHLAWIASDEKWDALFEHDVAAVMARSHLRGEHAWIDEERERSGASSPHEFWNEYVPEAQRAYLKIMRYVSLDRVVAVDPIGDGYYPVPHIFVDSSGAADPFEPAESVHFERPGMFGGGIDFRPTRKNRARLFPDPLPSTLHPPPTGFDHAPPANVAALSAETRNALGGALAAVTQRRADASAPEPDVRSASEDRLGPFREWARDVAMPVFDAFVREIRAAGQGARIATERDRGAAAAIELRVAFDAGHRHSDYQTPGHFRVSAFGHSGEVKVDVRPQVESGSRYGAPPAPKLADLTQERIEKEVVQMIERVRAGR